MKRILTSSIVLLFACLSGAMAQGIEFEHGTWAEAVKKAKQANKPIFVDVYTSWCGPCKIMAAEVFTKPQIGEKYNRGFINVKIDAEKGEGIALAKKYVVKAYPTYLFINPNNESLIGNAKSSMPIAEFADLGDNMLNKYIGKTLLTLEEMTAKFKAGNFEEDFLQAYIKRLRMEKRPVYLALNAYLERYILPGVNKDRLFFLASNYTKGGGNAYNYLVKNYQDIDALLCEKDGLVAANFDRELVSETKAQMDAIMVNRKLTNREKETELEKYYSHINTFSTNKDKGERLIIATKRTFYRQIKDSTSLLKNERAYILEYVLPDEQTGSINKEVVIIDKNATKSVSPIDSLFAAEMVANSANDILKLSKDANDVELAVQLLKKAKRLTPFSTYYDNRMNMMLYNVGEQKRAVKQQTILLKTMVKRKDALIPEAEALLQQMKNKEAVISFVRFNKK